MIGGVPKTIGPQNEIAPQSTKPPAVKRVRRKLWHLPRRLHCPVIGTCLSVQELRKLAKGDRAAISRASDYDIHVNFVSAAEEKNSYSLAVQKALEKKYKQTIKDFAAAKDEESLARLWQEHVEVGKVAGAFWALLTHPKATEALWEQAYEEVHMLSHQVGAGQQVELIKLVELQQKLKSVQSEYGDSQREYSKRMADRDKKIQRVSELERENKALKGELRRVQAQLEALESNRELKRLQTLVDEMESRLSKLGIRLENAQSQIRIWRGRYQGMSELSEQLKQELERSDAERHSLEKLVPDCDNCDNTDCPAYPDLSGKHILCVGGRSTLVEHYRYLVARCNGRFSRHDGGREDSRQRLAAMLASADAVICPADCVSHDAYNRTKRFCKQNGKTCVLLDSSGVSAFANALERVVS